MENLYDPSNLNREELFKLLNISIKSSKKNIENNINNLIENHSDNNIINFLKKSKNILLDNVNTDNVNTDNVNTDNVNTDNVNTDNVNTDNENTDNENTDNENTDNENIDNYFQFNYKDKNINHRLIKKFKTNLIVNSIYRNNSLYTDSSNFIINCDINNILSIRLSSIVIPNSWYSFDKNFNNLIIPYTTTSAISDIDISDLNNELFNPNLNIDESDISFISINKGYYNSGSEIVDALNKSTLSCSDISASIFNYDNDLNKIYLKNDSSNNILFIFYNTYIDTSSNYAGINNNLGYYLGFRSDQKDSLGNNLTSIENNSFTLYLPNNSEEIYSYSVLNLNKTLNIILNIDTFSNSILREKYITLSKPNNYIKLPSYYGEDLSGAKFENLETYIDITSNKNILTKSPYSIYTNKVNNPRKLSYSQLYTIQEIRRQNNIINSLYPYSINNSLASFLSTNNETTKYMFTYNESLPRLYTGPTNIQKMKVFLTDSNGIPLNINNIDWQFTLEIEQLYQ